MKVEVAVMLPILVLVFAVGCVNGERNITLPWGNKSHTYSIEMLAMYYYPEEMIGGYMESHRLQISRYNDSDRIHIIRGKIRVLKDLPVTAELHVTALRRISETRYKGMLYTFTRRNLCDFIENDFTIYYDLLKHSNLPKSCPVVKGDYEIKNYIVNEYYVPPEIPCGYWRVFWTIRDKPKGNIIFKIAVEFFTDHPYRVLPIP